MAIPEITTFDGYEDKDRKLDELVVITHPNGGKKYRVGAMKYCIDERCVGRKGYGIDPTDPKTAAMQFQKNAEFWGNENKNPFVQYMHTYLKETAPTAEEAMRLTNEIIGPVVKEHLAITVAHEEDHDKSLYYTHTYRDATNFNDGSMIYSDNTTNYDMAQRTADVIGKPVQLIVKYDYNGKEWKCPTVFVPHNNEDE